MKGYTKSYLLIITVFIIASGLLSLTSCNISGNITEGMETFGVQKGDIVQVVTATGYVQPDRRNTFSLQSAGEVLSALEKGEYFKKGDILIELDNSSTELILAQSGENINISKNSLELAKINYQQALDANHIAVQLSGNSAQQAELAVKNALIALENANNMANKSVHSARVALKNAEKILEEASDEPMMTETQITQFQANVDSSEAALDSAKASRTSSIESAEGAYDQSLLNQSATYWSNLGNTENTGAQIAITRKNIELAETQLRLAELNYELARLDIDNNIIYAPYDGLVFSSSFKEGEYGSPGVPAIEIISGDFIITSDVNETDMVNLAEGQEVEIQLDAYYDKVFKGEIIEISPISINIGGVVSFEIKVMPETPDSPEFKYGLSASLSITTSRVESVLYVPIESIFEEDGKQYVEVLGDDGKSLKTEVRTGTFNYDFIEILSGVDEGDTIVISGLE
ncbi:MAG: HlyD family efflux transporter periplasmic adaptor subunit [Actinobacteria bacterium]|nr:HlyD family efflux transporter periplasmic adaptor subunit [Actinomycetota bacterium]